MGPVGKKMPDTGTGSSEWNIASVLQCRMKGHTMTDAPPHPAPAKTPRMEGIDALRGLVMVIMALDHSRDFFSNSHAYFDPIDVHATSAAFFLTRWITDFCAPVFSFLAGIGVYISMSRGKPIVQVSKTLFTRGLWLIFLELVILRVFWYFNFDYTFLKAGVIWCLGWSMIFLAVMIFLPFRIILFTGLLLILPHNLLDGIRPESFGGFSWLWMILHVKGTFAIGESVKFLVVYPLIPWLGLMATGFCFGRIMLLEREQRRRIVFLLGLGLTTGFIFLRGSNFYGDPVPWTIQKSGLFTLFNILACEKYPPSVSYLLMTMGPAFMLLSALDRPLSALMKPFVTFGRVPFLYYMLHLPLLHAMAVPVALYRWGKADWLFANPPDQNWPHEFHLDLFLTYAAWLLATLMLYPLCRRFAHVKSTRKDWWLSYL